MSVLGEIYFGSSLSVREASTICQLSVTRHLKLGKVLTVLDALKLGSSLSLRAFVRFGSSLSAFGRVEIGPLGRVSVTHCGIFASTLSVRNWVKGGCYMSIVDCLNLEALYLRDVICVVAVTCLSMKTVTLHHI